MQSNHSFAESRFPRLSFLRLTRNHGLLVCFCAQKNAQASHSSIGQICLRAFEALVTLLQTRSNGLVDEGKHGHASRNLSAAPRCTYHGIVPRLGSDSAPDGGQETEQPFHWTIFQRQLLGIKTPLNTVYILPGSGVRFTFWFCRLIQIYVYDTLWRFWIKTWVHARHGSNTF
jgi:hypothetical protein